MNPRTAEWEGESHETGYRAGKRPLLAGIEVREEDLEPQKGLDLTSLVVHISAGVILVLALGQFAAWWLDRPPGGAGMGLLVGDTIRLIVLSALLWAAGDVIKLVIKTHYDIRAARILLARQTYMMRHMGVASGELPAVEEPVGARRAHDGATDAGAS
ncbi:MAG TPA: hypothetical protein VGO40_04610 [Longimicrobium sp.]|jgi:hypothetical protein|nr:hypothetical protein [Longimicrobium sp.]